MPAEPSFPIARAVIVSSESGEIIRYLSIEDDTDDDLALSRVADELRADGWNIWPSVALNQLLAYRSRRWSLVTLCNLAPEAIDSA